LAPFRNFRGFFPIILAPFFAAADAGLAMLQTSIPGVPGEDYPILAEVPETAFSCQGQVDGGKRYPPPPLTFLILEDVSLYPANFRHLP
jgi:hypothetical protein